MTKLINGKEIAQNLRNELKKEIDNLRSKTGKVPGLAVVQVGNVAASSVYVKAKTKSAKEVGIEVIDHHLPEATTEAELLKIVDNLNNLLYSYSPFCATTRLFHHQKFLLRLHYIYFFQFGFHTLDLILSYDTSQD